jgi:hypothetical protein
VLADAAVERGAKLVGMDAVELVCLVDGRLELGPAEDRGQVDQGAGGGGDWDVVVVGAVRGIERRASMDPEPRVPRPAAGRH